jgi:hypothetical protein
MEKVETRRDRPDFFLASKSLTHITHLLDMLLIHLYSDLHRSSRFLSPRNLLKTFVFTVFLHNKSICTITTADTDPSMCIHVPGPFINSMNGLTKHSQTGSLRKGRILTCPNLCPWHEPNTLGQVAHRVTPGC